MRTTRLQGKTFEQIRRSFSFLHRNEIRLWFCVVSSNNRWIADGINDDRSII
jgi:hypothetical protein